MPSLRMNPKKKEIFEQGFPRPAKRIKTSSSATSDLLTRPVHPSGSTNGPQREDNGFMAARISSVSSHHLPLQSHPLLARPSPDQTSVPSISHSGHSVTIPPQSAVPSLTPDNETSDSSACSDPDKYEKAHQGRPVAGRNVKASSRETRGPRKIQSSLQGIQQTPPGRTTDSKPAVRIFPKEAYTEAMVPSVEQPPPMVLNQKHDDLTWVLQQASATLQEMETGQPTVLSQMPPNHSFPKADDRHGMKQIHPRSSDLKDASALTLDRSIAADGEIISILEGILNELATGVDHGHGLKFLPPDRVHYQHVHRERFIATLTNLRNEAAPKINTFVSPAATIALKSIYRSLSSRLPEPATIPAPLPVPPPGYQLIAHGGQQPKARLVLRPSSQRTPKDVSHRKGANAQSPTRAGILPSNAPPLPRIAPKSKPSVRRSSSVPVANCAPKQVSVLSSMPVVAMAYNDYGQSRQNEVREKSTNGSKRKHGAFLDDAGGT